MAILRYTNTNGRTSVMLKKDSSILATILGMSPLFYRLIAANGMLIKNGIKYRFSHNSVGQTML